MRFHIDHRGGDTEFTALRYRAVLLLPHQIAAGMRESGVNPIKADLLARGAPGLYPAAAAVLAPRDIHKGLTPAERDKAMIWLMEQR